MTMTENEILAAIFLVTILAIALLATIGDVIVTRYKAAREQQAKERARETDLFARYQQTRTDVERAAGQNS